MRKPPVDPTSEAFQVGKSVMSDGKPGIHPAASQTGMPHSIDITPSDNGGCTVCHMPKETGKNAMGGGDYSKKQTHTFTDMPSAHAHIGKLMGVGVAPKGNGLN